MSKFVKFFNELKYTDVPQVGGKNASLGEMYRKLSSKGVKVPNGFATTAEAYNFFMEKAGLKTEIKKIWFQELHGVLGKRYIYFCTKCKSVLGVSHRKGFWMG